MSKNTESPEEFVAFASKSPERLMVVGAIAQLSIDPPERFYTQQLSRALMSYVSGSLTYDLVQGLRGVDMITEYERLPPRRIIYVRAAVPAWESVKTAIQEKEIIVPEFREDLEELNRAPQGPNPWEVTARRLSA